MSEGFSLFTRGRRSGVRGKTELARDGNPCKAVYPIGLDLVQMAIPLSDYCIWSTSSYLGTSSEELGC